MNFKKVLFPIILLLLITIVSFYIWASQTVHNELEYVNQSQFTKDFEVKSDTFSLMTFNIGYLSGMTNNLPMERSEQFLQSNLDNAIQMIRNIAPDIVGFQEIDFHSNRSGFVNQYAQIASSVPFYNGAMVVNWDKRYVPFPYWPLKFHFGEIYSGQAIISNFNILSNSRVVMPKPESNFFFYNDFYLDRLIQKVWLEFNNDSLLALNVHFEAWNSETREIQAQMVLEIVNEYCDNYPILLFGDFNCHPPFISENNMEKTIDVILSNKSISMVTDKNQYLLNPDKFFTFSSESPYEKIDYIFYNNCFLNCIESRVVHEAGQISDHFPIYAKFSLKKEQ